MNKELILALDMLEKEKNIKKELMFEALETALATAYKKNSGQGGDVVAEVNRETGAIRVYQRKVVVDDFDDEMEDDQQILLKDAKDIDARYEIGDIIEFDADPADFSRIAAQTAKQIVVQKIREAERGNLVAEYSDKENDIMSGKIEKTDRRGVLIDMGHAEAILAPKEQIQGEDYSQGRRIKVYVLEVRSSAKSVDLIVSRTHPNLVKKLFEQEIPEVADGTVVIRAISREAGSRTKIAVESTNPDVDAVGACVGPKGARIGAVLDELGEEKIDVVPYSEDIAEFISAALAPAKVDSVSVDEENKSALVIVPEYQLSLAIGKEGQNARLAARLTGWKVDIKSDAQGSENE